MSVINTNISALQASNASSSASNMLAKSMQRLSTGSQINSAADNAAGLAISTSMTSQINGMNQGIQNANDGISLSQTAQGSLTEVTNMLQRVRTLAVQSSSGTYQTSDRANMQSEVSALTTQIGSVLSNTTFNNNALFSTTSGTNLTFSIQAGANTSDAVTLTSTGIDGTKINSTALDVTTQAKAGTTISNVDAALAQVATTDAGFGAGQNQLQSAVNNLNNNITNLTSAKSQITDTNYSAETTQLAKAQILSQASTAMIAQANQSQQSVLSLLK
jgi:flagellin